VPPLPLSLLLAMLANASSQSSLVVPNFRDLTIKTRMTVGENLTTVMTWYFRGTRQRLEIKPVGDRGGPQIIQCDQGVRLVLNESAKTYYSVPVDLLELRKTAKPARQLKMSGGEVIVTTDSVDTGERRQLGSYEARHIKSTITAEPSPGAVSRASKTEIDGWYIDLPGMYCRDDNMHAMGWSTTWSDRQDRVIFKRLGTARRGLAIEETSTKTEAGHVYVNKTALIEISEQPLDQSLFEVPADYSHSH